MNDKTLLNKSVNICHNASLRSAAIYLKWREINMRFWVDLVNPAFLLRRFVLLQIYYRAMLFYTYVEFICVQICKFSLKVSHRLHAYNWQHKNIISNIMHRCNNIVSMYQISHSWLHQTESQRILFFVIVIILPFWIKVEDILLYIISGY